MENIILGIEKQLDLEFGYSELKQNLLFDLVGDNDNDLSLLFKGVPTEDEITALQTVFEDKKVNVYAITFNNKKANERVLTHDLYGCNGAEWIDSLFDIAIDRLRNGLTNGNILTVKLVDKGIVPTIYFCDELAKRGVSFEEQNYLFSLIENHKGAWTVTLKTTINNQYILRILQTLNVVCEWYCDYISQINLKISGQICSFDENSLKKILLKQF